MPSSSAQSLRAEPGGGRRLPQLPQHSLQDRLQVASSCFFTRTVLSFIDVNARMVQKHLFMSIKRKYAFSMKVSSVVESVCVFITFRIFLKIDKVNLILNKGPKS